MSPHLARIRLFPVKSLDGQDVEEAVVLRSGGLVHDREYCLIDQQGEILNGKRIGAPLLRIRSEVHFAFGEIRLSDESRTKVYHLCRDKKKIERWFSRRLGQPVRLAHDPERGFPDDRKASGPTMISTATLQEAASWFSLDLEEARRRFRANLEIDGVEAFWEDRLFGPPGETRPFRVGEVAFEGVNPCARCAVPSRDSLSGEITEPVFAKIFAERRRETLPEWAPKSRFDHFYRLAVNTRIPESEAGKALRLFDEVLVESRSF